MRKWNTVRQATPPLHLKRLTRSAPSRSFARRAICWAGWRVRTDRVGDHRRSPSGSGHPAITRLAKSSAFETWSTPMPRTWSTVTVSEKSSDDAS